MNTRRKLIAALAASGVGSLAYTTRRSTRDDRTPPSDLADGRTDWSMFGGDSTNDGHQMSNPGVYNSPAVSWQHEYSNAGVSDPVITHDTVYFASLGGRVTAFEIETGEKRWEYETADREQFFGSPALVDGRLVVRSASLPRVHAIDARDGDRLWSFSGQNDEEVFVHGSADPLGAQPTGYDGTAYAFVGGTDPRLFAIDIDSGEPEWTVEVEGRIRTTPAVADGLVYFATANRLSAFEIGSGDARWSARSREFQFTTPIVSDNTVYLASSDRTFQARDASTGDLLWDETVEGGTWDVPASDGKTVYANNSTEFYALDADDGSVQWRLSDSLMRGQPVIVDRTVYVGSTDGLLAIDSDTGTVRWEFDTGATVRALAASGRRIVAVTSADELYCIE